MSVEHFHPELRLAARRIPRFSSTPLLERIANRLLGRRSIGKLPQVEGVEVSDVMIPVDAAGMTSHVRLSFHGFEVGGIDTQLVQDFRGDYFEALSRPLEPILERTP